MIECLDFDLGMWFIHIWIGRSDASLFCFSISFFLGFLLFVCILLFSSWTDLPVMTMLFLTEAQILCIYVRKKLSWTRTVWGIFLHYFVSILYSSFWVWWDNLLTVIPVWSMDAEDLLSDPTLKLYFLHKSEIDIAFLKEKKWFCFLCFSKNWEAFSWFFNCFGMRWKHKTCSINFWT